MSGDELKVRFVDFPDAPYHCTKAQGIFNGEPGSFSVGLSVGLPNLR
jgi:hypothetical protein